MWVDELLTAAEKVSVKNLEAENRKLKATVLSIIAQLRNMNDNHPKRINELQCDIDDELTRFLLMFFAIGVYTVTMATMLP